MTDRIRILVADDHPLFRQGVINALAGESDLEIIAEANSGEEAFDLVASLLPDIVMMDLAMPGEGGIAATQRITNAFPVVRTIMLTVSENEDDLMNSLKAGAHGYVLKGASGHELGNAIRAVATGGVYMSSVLARTVLFEMQSDASSSLPSPLSGLTERETEILSLVGDGLTNREIANRLDLAEKTVKHYMTNVLQKLQVRSRVEAALLAQKHGFNTGRTD